MNKEHLIELAKKNNFSVTEHSDKMRIIDTTFSRQSATIQLWKDGTVDIMVDNFSGTDTEEWAEHLTTIIETNYVAQFARTLNKYPEPILDNVPTDRIWKCPSGCGRHFGNPHGYPTSFDCPQCGKNIQNLGGYTKNDTPAQLKLKEDAIEQNGEHIKQPYEE